MKNKKTNKKIIVAMVLGLFLTGVVYATTQGYLYDGNEVEYDNSTSGLTSDNVQGALEELITKSENARIDSNSIDFSTIQTNTSKTILASSKGVCINRNNKLNCFKINNFAEESSHIQDVFSDVSCTVRESVVSCNASDFRCGVYSAGYVSCRDNGASEFCGVDGDGSVGFG